MPAPPNPVPLLSPQSGFHSTPSGTPPNHLPFLEASPTHQQTYNGHSWASQPAMLRGHPAHEHTYSSCDQVSDSWDGDQPVCKGIAAATKPCSMPAGIVTQSQQEGTLVYIKLPLEHLALMTRGSCSTGIHWTPVVYITPLFQDLELYLIYPIHRNKQRVRQNAETTWQNLIKQK